MRKEFIAFAFSAYACVNIPAWRLDTLKIVLKLNHEMQISGFFASNSARQAAEFE